MTTDNPRIAPTIDLEKTASALWGVAIIGGGPAGAIAALQTARQGVRVLLIDRATFPRTKVCGCCLSGAALHVLDSVGLGCVPKACHAKRLTALHLASKHRIARVPLRGGVSLSRERFDAALVRAAIGAGAEFVDSTRATVQKACADSATIALQSTQQHTTIKAKVIVVASGLGAKVFGHDVTDGRAATSTSRVGAGVVLDDGPPALVDGTIYMVCHRDGYVGLVRLEDDRLAIAAAFDSTAIKRAGGVGALATEIVTSSSLPTIDNLHHAPWQGTAKLTQRRRVFGDRYLIAGDAAGYIEPFTGEGMAWAMATGKAIVPFALESIDGGTTETGPRWMTRHRQLLGRRTRMCRTISVLVRRPMLITGAVRVLTHAPVFAAPLVRSLNTPLDTQ